MKHVSLVIGLCSTLLVWGGCGGCGTKATPNNRSNNEAARLQQQLRQLQADNLRIREESGLKDEYIFEVTETLNTVLDGLSRIAHDEGVVRKAVSDMQTKLASSEEITISDQETYSLRQRLDTNLRTIERTIEESRRELQRLSENTGESEKAVRLFQATIRSLKTLVEEKDKAIATLRTEMNDLIRRVAALQEEVEDLTDINDSLKVAIGTVIDEVGRLRMAYYIVAKKSVLKNKRIVYKPIIGHTRVVELDARHFTTIDDYAREPRIPMPQPYRAYKILSDHKLQPHLYSFTSNRSHLIIKNPEVFWTIGRFLVVEMK